MKILVTAMPESQKDCPFGAANDICRAEDKGDTLFPNCCEFDYTGKNTGRCPHLMVLPLCNERYLPGLNDPDLENRYALLHRLYSDCNYFLLQKEMGIINEDVLWAKSVAGQISVMKVLWESFPEDGKPEWLPWDTILYLEREMTSALGDKEAAV